MKSQSPLPETADEVCAVARALRSGSSAVRLGQDATETAVKRMSAARELARYRMLHFATHAALAGEAVGASEPGLILTPPATATPADDGYLSASEISALQLDADLVILSACNTAAGGAGDSEALADLARSFFYAGARALFVSHWAVHSDATAKLITTALSAMSASRGMTYAEALRTAMTALIDHGSAAEAHRRTGRHSWWSGSRRRRRHKAVMHARTAQSARLALRAEHRARPDRCVLRRGAMPRNCSRRKGSRFIAWSSQYSEAPFALYS